jgi:RHS repeat-associated protein
VYGPGLAVDQPLSITRYEYRSQPSQSQPDLTWPPFTWILFPDYRASPVYGLFSDGAWAKPHTLAPGQTTCPLVGPNRCVLFQWPLAQAAYNKNRGKVQVPAWHGTLLEHKRDGAGLEYARNRVYDPATGRFTQEDPIGLAGGLNLYGFANGDPINFSDPFGLCVPWCLVAAAWAAYEIGGAAYDVYNAANALANRSLSRTEKLTTVGLAAASVFGPGAGFTAGARTVSKVIGEGAELIGRAGRGRGVREVAGGAAEARALFDRLAQGAEGDGAPKSERRLHRDAARRRNCWIQARFEVWRACS